MSKTHVVSWSEIDCFRQCPFKHMLSYKQRWTKTPRVGSPLSRGSLFHSVLEAHYLCLQSGGSLADAREVVDPLFFSNGEQNEDQVMVQWIYEGYIALYADDPNWKVVAVEYANEFWLPTASGTRSNFKLKLKIDLIVQDPARRLWIVDHKTCKDLPTEKMMELDDQFGLYTWGLRQLGKTVHGAMHNACRTTRYKDPNKPQPLDERFRRTLLYRTDEELDRIALEAYATARRAWSDSPIGEQPERNPNTDTCRWRCDYTEDCLASRKGVDLREMLVAHGFEQNFERH